MNVKSIMQLAISAVVILVVITAFVIPLTSSATNHNVVFENPAQYSANMISNAEPVTIDYDAGVYKINGVTVSPLNANYAAISSDGLIVRWSGGNPTGRINTSTGWQSMAFQNGFHIVAQNGHGVGTVAGSDVSFDYTFLYYQNEQDYTMTVGGGSFYVTDSDIVTCTGFNLSLAQNSTGQFFIMRGSIADGFTFTTLTGVDHPFKSMNAEKVEGYENLYKVTSLVFDNNGQDVVIDRCIVPDKVTAVKVHDGAVDALVSLVPLLFVVSVVVAVVGSISLRPRD